MSFTDRGSVSRRTIDLQSNVLRGARWSELLFGLIALLIALGLPATPLDAHMQFLLVHWYAVALTAFGLVAALRQPSRHVLALTFGLSMYFLTTVAFGLADGRSRSNVSFLGGAPFMLSPLLVGMAALAQISVAIRCWRARGLWRQRAGESPVATDV